MLKAGLMKCGWVAVSVSNRSMVFRTIFVFQVQAALHKLWKDPSVKLPITNTLLKAISAIHPDARGNHITLKYLQKLPRLATNILDEDEIELYDMEIRNFQTDKAVDDINDDERLDV
jgi:hypothetical protein